MNRQEGVLPDSSFYLCFLDDIKRPEILIMFTEKFDFFITPIVKGEIEKSKNHKCIENKKIKLLSTTFSFGEILRPFLSRNQLIRGEHEIIGLAYIMYQLKISFYLIIDDSQARKFVGRNLSYLADRLNGTVNFIGLCCSSFKILKKEETLKLFDQIESSKFRIKKDTLNNVREQIKDVEDVP